MHKQASFVNVNFTWFGNFRQLERLLVRFWSVHDEHVGISANPTFFARVLLNDRL